MPHIFAFQLCPQFVQAILFYYYIFHFYVYIKPSSTHIQYVKFSTLVFARRV